MQMLQSWSKGNINDEIELYSSRSLQNPGFMALALMAPEKQSLIENLTEIDKSGNLEKVCQYYLLRMRLTFTLQEACLIQILWL